MWTHTFEGCVLAENQVLCSGWTSVAAVTVCCAFQSFRTTLLHVYSRSRVKGSQTQIKRLWKKPKPQIRMWSIPQKSSEPQEPATYRLCRPCPVPPQLSLKHSGIPAHPVGKRSLQVPQTKMLLLNHWLKKNPNAPPREIWGFVLFCETPNNDPLRKCVSFVSVPCIWDKLSV